MRKFGIVLQYEIKEYINNKSFMIVTILLALVSSAALFLPRFVDLSGLTGVSGTGGSDTGTEIAQSVENTGTGDSKAMLLLDQGGYVNMEVLKEMFPGYVWTVTESVAQMEDTLNSQGAEAGFVVKSFQKYDYYVYNKGMFDNYSAMFMEAMKVFYRMDYCARNNLDFGEITAMYEVPIAVNEQVLNKDTESNYWYCYGLVVVVFMLIVFYGQMIAVSVTNEKSNRAIEVLVTSTTPNSLLFGKVIAGAIGGLFQAGLIMGALLASYQINRTYWGGMLDMVFAIPTEVIVTFALFGLGGYLFYGFLYGAMGAMVSKTEDISKSSGGLMMIIMVVYFFSLTQLFNADGIIIKVLSFLPFSSYSTMFARIAMGTVSIWEIVVSFLILVASIYGTGLLGAKLYRMGTLRYGNPIKFRTALKDIRHMD